MSDTPETDAMVEESFHRINFPTAPVPAEFARKLERERNEAREKVEQQRKEIVRLNGATSHAGGTPLKIALRERDEAREALRAVLELANDIPDESLDDWKIEFHKVLEEAK